jgi:excisionase family DNA binding protein
MLTVRQVAAILRVSTATVYKLCVSGTLSHSRVCNSIRVSPADLESFAAQTRRRQ